MSLYNVVKEKLDRLIDIMQTDGVQPCDLANNISIDCYKSITYRKMNDQIVGELVIEDIIENKKVDTILRYIYSSNLRILRIEEEFQGDMTVKWDRESIETELISDIINILQSQYSTKRLKEFFNTLPEDLKNRIARFQIDVA